MTKSESGALLARITANPEIYGGKPIIRGKRLSVEQVFADLAAGETADAVLANFPFLEIDDIRACLLFASREVGRSTVTDVPPQGPHAAAGR